MTTNRLRPGDHSISASYAGDTDFNPISGPAMTQHVEIGDTGPDAR